MCVNHVWAGLCEGQKRALDLELEEDMNGYGSWELNLNSLQEQ